MKARSRGGVFAMVIAGLAVLIALWLFARWITTPGEEGGNPAWPPPMSILVN